MSMKGSHLGWSAAMGSIILILLFCDYTGTIDVIRNWP